MARSDAKDDSKAGSRGGSRAGSKAGAAGAASEAFLPAIDFSTFLLSLSTSALYQMGLVPNPETGEKASPDRTIARQTIDTLVMLREKTRGNLEEEEDKLFESLLYELRMHFLKLGPGE